MCAACVVAPAPSLSEPGCRFELDLGEGVAQSQRGAKLERPCPGSHSSLWLRSIARAENTLARHQRLLRQIVSGRSDANIRFDELRTLLDALGFEERMCGSHHIFRKDGVSERVNLQRAGSHAKQYQVRQVRRIIVAHELFRILEDD